MTTVTTVSLFHL